MGNRYFIQVSNRASVPWKVDQAKLEGVGGEILRVEAIRWAFHPRSNGSNVNINVIVAEVPEDAGADYALKSIELVGQDARVASFGETVSLP